MIEPCPCCGGTDLIEPSHPDYLVYCKTCFLRAVNLTAWNTRARPVITEAMVEAGALAIVNRDNAIFDLPPIGYLDEIRLAGEIEEYRSVARACLVASLARHEHRKELSND